MAGRGDWGCVLLGFGLLLAFAGTVPLLGAGSNSGGGHGSMGGLGLLFVGGGLILTG